MREFLVKYKQEHRKACKFYCEGRYALAVLQRRFEIELKNGVKRPSLAPHELSQMRDNEQVLGMEAGAFLQRAFFCSSLIMLCYTRARIAYLCCDNAEYSSILYWLAGSLARCSFETMSLVMYVSALEHATPGEKGIMLSEIAFVFVSTGRFPQAQVYFKRALRIAKSYNLLDVQAKCSMNRGMMYIMQGLLKEAERDLNVVSMRAVRDIFALTFTPLQALNIYERLRDDDKICVCCERLGTVYRNTGQSEQAKALFERALSIASRRYGPESSRVNRMFVLHSPDYLDA